MNAGFTKIEENDNWTAYEVLIDKSTKEMFKTLSQNAREHSPGKVTQMLYDFEEERLFFKVRL